MGRIYSDPKNLKGVIYCSRTRSNVGEDYIVFRAIDEVSNLVAFEFKMTVANFGEMISSPSNTPCEIQVYDSSNLGKKVEQKTEIIPRPDFCDKEKEIDEILKPYEVDGWIGSRSDIKNSHRWVDRDKVRVGFVRWVASEDKE